MSENSIKKATTEKNRLKKYKCSQCNYEKNIETNHYGQCYSLGNYNACPKCAPYKRPTTWVCNEEKPAHLDTPPN